MAKLLALVCLLLVYASGNAQDKVAIKSDRHSGSEDGGMVFAGNVLFEYASMVIKADRLVLKQQDSENVELVAEGSASKLASFSYNNQESGLTLEAEAKSVTYEHTSGNLVLEGNVKIIEQANSIEAAEARYNIATGEFTASGSADGGQVVSTFELPSSRASETDDDSSE